MSKRHRTLDELYGPTDPADTYDWWDDPIPGYEQWTWAQWQDAWADLTLSVVQNIWHKHGARLYATHRDTLLREDLYDWLIVEAQTLANQFTPYRDDHAPERRWMAYLYAALTPATRWHFEKAVGQSVHAQNAWRKGIASTDMLTAAVGDGWLTERMALHGRPFGTEDPAAVVIRLEELSHQVDDLNDKQPTTGTYTTSSGGPCIINLCTRPAKVRGLCDVHWRQERNLTGNLDRPCNVPGCGRTHKGRGLCGAHHQALTTGRLPAELHQYVEAAGRKPGPKPSNQPCSEDDCTAKAKSRGLCPLHYGRWRRAQQKQEA
ncbi:hypothetical protein AA0Y32_06065 [Georgenia phoenicis]|uniref:hypothetical protein n=1 Tax=unclassified Georgenia TaxID=2626815 RepID=UPI0039AF7893